MNAVSDGVRIPPPDDAQKVPSLQRRDDQRKRAHEVAEPAPRAHDPRSTRGSGPVLSRGTEQREHGRGFRPHAAPDEERFGGLLDQHAKAVGDAPRAELARELEERRVAPVPYIMS